MPLPLLDSGVYSTAQLIDWELYAYESHGTTPATGLGFRMGAPATSFTTSAMGASADSVAYMESNSTPVFTDAGSWKYGRAPLVLGYWESGAPPGITTARYVVQHWRGYIDSGIASWVNGTGKFWLGFAGKGHVKVVYNGTTVQFNGANYATLSDKAETYSDLITPTHGQTIDIFYWQLGEEWGGVVGKMVPQKHSGHTTPVTSDYRDAPVVSASLFPYSTAAATRLYNVSEIRVDVQSPTATTKLTFNLDLIGPNSSIGWAIAHSPTRLTYYDGTTTTTLKRGQLVKFYGGFVGELYPRFTGNILSFEERGGQVIVSCESVEARMSTAPVENYPDRISYCTFGYFRTTKSSEPVRNVGAYDNWPLEHVIKDLSYKGGIDSKLMMGTKPSASGGVFVDSYDTLYSRPVYDAFTDTNGTALSAHTADTGQSWIQTTSVTIQSNAAYTTSTSTLRPRIESEVTDRFRIQGKVAFSASASGGTVGVLFRGDSAASTSYTGYQVVAVRTSTSAASIQCHRVSSGSASQLLSVTGVSWASGTSKVLIVEVLGYTFNIYLADSNGLNKVYIGTVTDSVIGKGNQYVGMRLTAQSTRSVTVDDFSVYEYEPLRTLKARSLSGNYIKLQRQSNYGNSTYDFSDAKPVDDSYIYNPDASRSAMDWAHELADGFGYDFRSNAFGNLVLTSRNNPHRGAHVTAAAGGATVYDPYAYGGYYQQFTSTFTVRQEVVGSRIDLIAGRKDGLGVVAYTVYTDTGVTVASGTIDLDLSGETDGVLLYSNRFAVDSTNASVFKLYSGAFGNYVVQLTDSSGTEWWLNGFLLYDIDPTANVLAQSLDTSTAILDLQTDLRAEDSRNHIIVIGKRLAAITDSAKFRNPNNPQYEFVVSAASDPASIWDNDDDYYLGYKNATIIVDDTVADQDYADWVSQTLLLRQRDPKPSANITNTIIPILEPRDCFNALDSAYGAVVATYDLWVESYQETYTHTEATTSVNATAYPEIPSYEPTEDLSLEIIDTVYGGNPVINISVVYPSLDSGVAITDPGPGLPQQKSYWRVPYPYTPLLSVSSDGNGSYIDMSSSTIWPPLPDSIVLLSPDVPAYPQNLGGMGLKNTPYTKFWHIYDYTDPKIHIPFLSGDGTAGVYDRAGWGYDDSTVALLVKGRSTTDPEIYSGQSPFYDPYTSELADGLLVNVSFSALVSGYYRVSIWGTSADGSDPVRVAWLTEPGADSTEDEAHWAYMKAGKNKLFLWDGVDNIGDWNSLQSEQYAWDVRGAFSGQDKPRIGKGFYAWNDRTRPITTISYQKTNGKITYPDDRYSQFYVRIECQGDVFVDSINPTREVRSDQLDTTNGQNSQNEMYIYTHLPQPTQVEITSFEDWDPSSGDYDEETNPTAGWTSSPDAAATMRNGKPIRVTFAAVQRPGNRFTSSDQTTFRLVRQVHLNANIFDIFMIQTAIPWNNKSHILQKRLVCRKLTNSEHTVSFEDDFYRTGDTLATAKWIFEPQDFKINDRGLTYCNYLQLEDVPEYTTSSESGENTSRFIMAYMNYLFYFSAHAQDRSGRFVGALDRSFVDTGKIVNNTFETEFPEDCNEYFSKTYFVRQWNDPDYVSSLASEWSIAAGNQKYIQFFLRRLEPNDTASGDTLRLDATGGAVTGDLTTTYSDVHSSGAKSGGHLPSDYDTDRQLGTWSGGVLTNYFGDWTWEGETTISVEGTRDDDPLWIPCPTRDWHGYYVVPPMVVPTSTGGFFPTSASDPDAYWYTRVRVDDDEDPSISEVWNARTFGMASRKGSSYPFGKAMKPDTTVEDEITDKKPAESDHLNFSKQDELLHWEEFRGCRTGKGWRQKLEPLSLAQVVPGGGPYMMNFYRYDSINKQSLEADSRRRNVIYHAANLATRPSSSITSWFEATFRYQYNWESAKHFPVDQYGRLASVYINNKYTAFTLPSNLVYDAGAWAGWKDDSSGTGLRWLMPTTGVHYSGAIGGENALSSEVNIFNTNGDFLAVGPETPEKVHMIVSLALENRRRATPVAGH